MCSFHALRRLSEPVALPRAFLQSGWLEAAQLLLWRDGAYAFRWASRQAAVYLRLLVVEQAQAEAACAPGASLPHRVSPELHPLPRLQQPRAPALPLSSLREVLCVRGGRAKQRPSSHIIFLPFTLWPSLFFLLLCILIGADQDRWPKLGWERPCLYPAQLWSSGVLCSAKGMRSILTDSRAPADLSPGDSFPGPGLWLPSYSRSLCFLLPPAPTGEGHLRSEGPILCPAFVCGGGGLGGGQRGHLPNPHLDHAPSASFVPLP